MERYPSWKRPLDQNAVGRQSKEDFIASSAIFCETLGFCFFVYAICESVPFTRPKIHTFGNYPTQWLKRYRTQNYAVTDPTIRHCKRSTEPLRWGSGLFDNCQQLWSDANDHGLSSAVTQPSFNIGGCTGFLSLFSTRKTIDDAEFEALKPSIKAFSDTLRSWTLKFDETLVARLDIELRHREKEILRWTADGKTSEETGLILNITADAVNFHIRNIQKKLGACNRVQAVTYAVAQGYI